MGTTAPDLEKEEFLDELRRKTQLPNEFLELNDFWKELLTKLPKELWPLFIPRDGAAKFTKKLPETFSPQSVTTESDERRAWELVGLVYFNLGRFHEARAIFTTLYYHILSAQEGSDRWAHKGVPLFWMSDCFSRIGCPVIAKRYLMLTLCEDAIAGNGGQNLAKDTGVYFRLVWHYGLSDSAIKKYAEVAHQRYRDNPDAGLFPESILQELDKDWIAEVPLPSESVIYVVNKYYVNHLMSTLGKGDGKALERLAEYLLSCIPGCRTYRGIKTSSTEYDVICSMEGFNHDFRSEFGRYFACECKDWESPADFTTMAKFCRVLDSIKSRFGILFSKNGISGSGKTKDAEREQLKVFQDRGTVIVVIDENDLKDIVDGGRNFISLLRQKYEGIRLDLPSSQAPKAHKP